MNISILVFGSDDFLGTLPDQIHNATALKVEVIANLNQAVSHIQMTPPDIILVQASVYNSLELCCWLKEQINLSWIYCILLEDRPQLLTDKSKYGGNWELETTCSVLRQGADAYIWCVETEAVETLHATSRLLGDPDMLLATAGIDGTRRAEELDIEDFVALANAIG